MNILTKKTIAEIERNILTKLQTAGADIVSDLSLDSTRAVGDAVQTYVQSIFHDCIPAGFLKKVEDGSSRRSMEDFAFYDKKDNYYAGDVKTHNIGTDFNMPNLISVKRLASFYRNNTNYFCILMIGYKIRDGKINYSECKFRPIECFRWDCLTLGALGWGQIQIRNSNAIKFTRKYSRKEWMLTFCGAIGLFYENEISKIKERKTWFQKEHEFWEKHK